MLVKAKCTTRAWDSGAAVLFYPGDIVEIEHDGHLASLKQGSSYVFDFDRSMSGSGMPPAPGGFICKGCGKVCNSLNELGTHSRTLGENACPGKAKQEGIHDEDLEAEETE